MTEVLPSPTEPLLDAKVATASAAAGPGEEKHVSFHPLAVRITTAPDGEPEQAMIEHAREELAHSKRRVAVRTYSWDTPQIGDATSKAWHSMLNGFSATLEPFLHASSPGNGGVCSASTTYRRESSPDRAAPSRSRSRSGSGSAGGSDGQGRARSGSRGRDDPASPLYDPCFIPAPRPRLSLKLPTIVRTSSRSATESAWSPNGGGCVFLCPRKSILRERCTPDAPPASMISSPPPAGLPAHAFPDLARTASPPPPPYHEPSSPTASDVVPILPCCAACEKAAVYGSEATRLGSYEEHWSRGARKARQEAEKREAARAQWRKAAEELGDRYRCPLAVSKRGSSSRAAGSPGHGDESENDDDDGDDDDEDEPVHPECPAYRLGEMVKRSGNIDELGRSSARAETPAADSAAAPTEQALRGTESASSTTDDDPEALADLSLASPTTAPPAPSEEQPTAAIIPVQPAIEPVRPTGRRRLSSISHKIAATLGGGLLSPPPGNVPGLRA